MTSVKPDRHHGAASTGPLGNAPRGSGGCETITERSPERSAISDILTGRRSAMGSPSPPHATDQPPPPSPAAERATRHSTEPNAIPIGTVAELGRLVKAARQRLNMPQEHFADLAGVGRRFVSELEAGKPSVEAERVLRCCLAAGIDILARPRR